MSATESSVKSMSVKGTFVVATSIKTSIATVAGPATYNGGALNGAIGAATMAMPRRITATLAANGGSYVNGSTITITGKDPFGAAQTDVLTIAGTGGGITLTSTKFFTAVTQLDIQTQTNTGGAFTFGTSDGQAGGRQLRVGTAGDVAVQYGDNSTDVIPNVQAGEQIPAVVSIILGTGTTAADITVYK